MYGINVTTPSFGHISQKEQSNILKKLAQKSSKQIEPEQESNIAHSHSHEHSEPEQSPQSNSPNHDKLSPDAQKHIEVRSNNHLKAPQYDDNPDSLIDSEDYGNISDQKLSDNDDKKVLKPSPKSHEHDYSNNTYIHSDCDRGMELRNTFFRLALLAVVLSFISWVILMIIMLLLDIKCSNIIYCIILDPIMMSKACVINGDDGSDKMKNSTILMVILTLWVVLISITYALLWQCFWRSKHNPLWSHHEQDITKLVIGFISLSKKEKISLFKRTFGIWSILTGFLMIMLLIEYFVEQYLYFVGGRYLYCFMVLTLGMVLVKIIGFVTKYEYQHYHYSMGDNETDKVLIEADSRNCRFHRQCILVIINTTLALYVPTFRVYPGLNTEINELCLKVYLEKLNQSATEATFFLWSAVISSQCIAFGIEMFNGYIFSYCLGVNKRSNYCTLLCFYIAACFSAFTAKELYFLHENWFLAVILFYYGVTFSWLNPSIFLIASLSIFFLCIVYKLRFILLNPQMLQHFVPDIIMLETILFILLCAFPTEFILLLPLYHNCKWISFGGIMIGFILTICVTILYYFIYRMKKLVTKHHDIRYENSQQTSDDNATDNGIIDNKIDNKIDNRLKNKQIASKHKLNSQSFI